MSRISGYSIAFIATPVAIFALFFGSKFYNIYRHTCARERTRFAIPDTSFEIGHSRIGNNPVVAEHDRDVVFFENGTPGLSSPLAEDTCGGYPINCYLIQTPNKVYLRLDDAVSEHLLDLTNQTVNLIAYAKGMAYYVKLTDAKATSGWSISENDLSTLRVTVGGNPAAPLAELIGYAKGEYIGRITGGLSRLRFIPASEASEIEIDHLSVQ